MSAELPDETQIGPGGLVLDTRTRRTFAGDQEIQLTRQSFDLLAYLLRADGRVVPTPELVGAIWGHTVVVGTHFVQTAVYRLRESLRSAGASVAIEAVRGVGYRVAAIEDDDAGVRIGGGWESALRVSALPAMIVDEQQRILFANEALARLTGYSTAELEALPSAEQLSPPSVRERRRTDLEALVAGSPDEGWSEPVVRRDGSIVHLELFARPIEVADGSTAVLVQLWLKHGESSEIEPLWRPDPRDSSDTSE